jgi:hypothetical protein
MAHFGQLKNILQKGLHIFDGTFHITFQVYFLEKFIKYQLKKMNF